ncbi:MAG TPA: hypothetical protein VFT12_14125 [Thermoanaerobaculia bacterium]|nr:hypothetical protein [Thermoanaerobaculia bacterium]
MRFLIALFIILSATSCASRGVSPDSEWSRVYLTDLQVARDAIGANHPGVVDRENPAFAAMLHSAYEEAREAAPQVADYDSYRVALARFANRFQDAHLSISFKKPFESLREAGIAMAYRGDEMVVVDIDQRYGPHAGRLPGASLASCDGVPWREHFERRVLSWRGRPSVEADWYRLAPLLFVDYGSPSPEAPSRCRFIAGTRPIDLELQWTATAQEQSLERGSEDARDLSLERLGNGVLWVNVPTFSVNETEQVAKMRSLIEEFGTEMRRGGWRLVVFDLRGNDGGSSSWGHQFARALFGEEWTGQALQWLGDGVYTEWRVSPENVEAVAGHVRQAEQRHGAESEAAKRSRGFHATMSGALARGDVFWSVPRTRKDAALPQPPPLPAKVVVVTGPSCFSACLDFLDVLRAHPDVVHTGHTTGVDTVYMENWGKPLPSGHASISYPMKVYRNRRRGNNEAYIPHVRYPGRLEDTEALRNWILAMQHR